MEYNSTNANTDGRALFAGEAWFDPIETVIFDRVRGLKLASGQIKMGKVDG